MKKLLVLVLLLTALACAQLPAPAPPRVYIDTTWNPPTGGSAWHAHTSSDFASALASAIPGDIIVLDAGVVYKGNFTLPLKPNPGNKWIYIESSALTTLPPPGTRVSPSDAAHMPRITTQNTGPAIKFAAGANHYRLIGLEITSNSNQGGNPGSNPPSNNFTYFLVGWDSIIGQTLPDSITVDRDYIHGSDIQDVGQGVQCNVTNCAVIDSYISDIHENTWDSQAVLAYLTPGPIKLVNNYLSATTEDVMFGGAAVDNLPYVPSDIEIRRNEFFKPLTWDSCGVHGTVDWCQKLADGTQCPGLDGNGNSCNGGNNNSPHHQWDEKNNLEFKCAQRVVATGNTLQNSWVSGQTGFSLLFTVREGGTGNQCVVNDILFQNNILTNVDAGINTLETDDLCPGCSYLGEARRIWVDNNLLLLRPSLDTYQHDAITFDAGLVGPPYHPGATDFIFQHNTVLMGDYSNLWNSAYFELPSDGGGCVPKVSPTHNVWILDNAMTRQPSGDCGYQGIDGLNVYMKDPQPVSPRFYGNVMFVPSGDRLQSFPVHNYSTMVPFTYVDPLQGDYQLATPAWTDTTDGKVAGIDWAMLRTAMGGLAPSAPIRKPLPALVR